jgi:hypothetical protein
LFKFIASVLFILSSGASAIEIVNFDFSKDFYQQLNIEAAFYYDNKNNKVRHEQCQFKTLTIDDLREYVTEEIEEKLAKRSSAPIMFTTDKFLPFYNLHKKRLSKMGVISCTGLLNKNVRFDQAVHEKIGTEIKKLSVSFFSQTGNLFEVKVTQHFPNSSEGMINKVIGRYITKWHPINIDTLRNNKDYLNTDVYLNGAKFRLQGGVECIFQVFRNNSAQTSCKRKRDFIYVALKEYPEIAKTFKPYIDKIYKKYIQLDQKRKGFNENFVY